MGGERDAVAALAKVAWSASEFVQSARPGCASGTTARPSGRWEPYPK